VGNPSLSDVKAIMLGVRNPKKRSIYDDDDGLPKCAEIWFNELRLTDFNDQSGWAATARMNALLADIGNVMVSGSYSTPDLEVLKKEYPNGKLKPSRNLISPQTCNWESFSPKTLAFDSNAL
jgi:cell surface protein SprA